MKFSGRRLLTVIVVFALLFDNGVEGSINFTELPAVKLGALFPIHVYSPNHSDCGRIQLEDGIQPLEALLFTLKEINSQGILPGFRLEVSLLLDSCDNVVHALEQSLQFIKGFICDQSHGSNIECRNDTLSHPYPSGYKDRLVGVIGGQASQVSIQVANLLRIFHIPQISYLSTSTALSNKEMFGYFYRTVPSDINQVSAILKILDYFKWTYVSLVYSNTEYGNRGMEEFERLAPSFNICFASLQRVNVDYFKSPNYDSVLINLLKHQSKAKVVIIFADKRAARGLMSAVKRQNAIGQFVWIGSDGWTGRHSVVERHEEAIEGTIAVQPMWGNLTGFDEYFTNLRPFHTTSNATNRWFNEFWEEFFQCRLKGGTNNTFNDKYDECTNNETIAENSNYRQQTYLHFVRDAAYAFAYALKDMHSHLCGPNSTHFCKQMADVLDGCRLKKYLDRVQFSDVNGKTFKFQHNGDGPPRYSILNYQNTPNGYIWKEVGSYMNVSYGSGLLNINSGFLRFFNGQTQTPKSYCSDPCLSNQEMIQQEGVKCCWICTNCSSNQILSDVQRRCQDCPDGTVPDDNLKFCLDLPVEYVDYYNHWAIAAIVVAGVGLMVTTGVGIVFWIYGDTPIVKAAGRELSFILLTGIFMSFGLTFVIVARPTVFICGTIRFFLGFCYTLCYSAIVTKTNRIARIFNSRHKRPQRTRYISPTSQVVITLLLTLTEVAINCVWLIFYPPSARLKSESRSKSLICLGSEDASYLVGLVYPFVLIGFCTVYAFKTRKCPDGFNEARYIAFANYTTTILWLAFMPLFFTSTNNVKRTITLSFSLSLAATVLLVCLFMPKIYKVLFKPEKNTKEGVMNQHRSCTAPFSPTIQINGSFSESGISKFSQPAASFTCLSNLASDSSISKQTRSHSADAAASITSPETTSKSGSLYQEKLCILES